MLGCTMDKIEAIIEEIKVEYQKDNRPWIVGFSAGKDSTCAIQLVYEMLYRLEPEERTKDIYVLSTNTMVESPAISIRLKDICNRIQDSANRDNLPIKVKLLRPAITETFWVNVIGRGYPCPNKWFRWCTDRLKIKPMNNFILNNVKKNGEVTIVLGTRKSESASRAASMEKHEIKNSHMRSHGSILGAFVYAPLEDLEEYEVWNYLLSHKSRWGDDNQELYKLYKGESVEANVLLSKDAEPTGHSRFGCWTCTVVDKDRALQSLIDEGHSEYAPLLEFRDKLKRIRDDENYREVYRRNQRMEQFYEQYYGLDKRPTIGKESLGPFKLSVRHELLKELLELQKELQKTIPEAELITPEEIEAIKMAWIYEGDDSVSVDKIVAGSSSTNDGIDGVINHLLAVEKDMSDLARRTGIYNKIEDVIRQYSMKTMLGEKK